MVFRPPLDVGLGRAILPGMAWTVPSPQAAAPAECGCNPHLHGANGEASMVLWIPCAQRAVGNDVSHGHRFYSGRFSACLGRTPDSAKSKTKRFDTLRGGHIHVLGLPFPGAFHPSLPDHRWFWPRRGGGGDPDSPCLQGWKMAGGIILGTIAPDRIMVIQYLPLAAAFSDWL